METIHRIELPSMHGQVNVYLLKGSVLTLVDAGADTSLCYQQLVEQLRGYGVTISDIEQVILTHMHADHVGLLSKIMKQSNASVFINKKGTYSFIGKGEPPLEQERQSHYMKKCFERWGADQDIKVFGRFFPEAVDRRRINFLREGDILFAGDRYYQVFETPGHSQLDICLYNEEFGTFIGGDLLLPTITPVAYIEPPFPNQSTRSTPLIEYRESLKKVPLNPTISIYPGHGEIFMGAEDWINKRIQKIETRCKLLLSILEKKNRVTVYQLCQEIYHKHYKSIPYTVLSDIVGHLDLLEKRELIYRQKEKNIDYYEVLVKV